jgi:hypothetical protein
MGTPSGDRVNKRVLIVEDNELNRHILKTLRGSANFESSKSLLQASQAMSRCRS